MAAHRTSVVARRRTSRRSTDAPPPTSTWILVACGIGSAGLLSLAQPTAGIAPLGIIGAVPWLVAVRRAKTAYLAIVLSFSFATAYGCFVASWIPEALNTLGSTTTSAAAGWILTVTWAKGVPLTAVGLTIWVLRRASPALQLLNCSACFYGFALLSSSWRLGVPWALLGHSQIGLPGAAQLAVVGGVPLLSAWLAAINMSIALAIGGGNSPRRLALALVSSWVAAVGVGLPLAKAARPRPPRIAPLELLVIQPAIPRYARWDSRAQSWILNVVSGYTTRALEEQRGRVVDAIIWPENLLTTPVELSSDLSKDLQRRVDQWGVPLITGLVRAPTRRRDGGYRSATAWIEPTLGITDVVDKFRAVPLVESGSTGRTEALLARLFGDAARWPRVEEAATAGSSLDGRFSVTPALCYEALFPGIVAQRRSSQSRAIVNLADDSWVKGEVATRQLLSWAAFRAIEQRLPLIRVAHGGASAVVSPFGEIITSLPLDEYAHALVHVEASAPPSASERIVVIGLPLLAGLGVWWLSSRWPLR